MHFFSLDRIARPFQFFRLFQPFRRTPDLNGNGRQTGAPNGGRVRSKQAQKNLPVLDVLEFRQTVSDTFFAGLSAAGVGVLGTALAAERSGDRLGATNLLDIAVSGRSNATSRPEVHRGG